VRTLFSYAVILFVVWCAAHSPCSRAADADPKLWAFRQPVRPAVPAVQGRERVRTPVDAFVLQKLEAKGLSLSADAERGALVRRLYFDLIGLPPTLADMDAALADRSADWYEALLDRLLASPHYGERWGRHWLDAAGYADTVKADNDINGGVVREGMWRYRDYVVAAVNADKPFDRFVLEQLAGDELVDLCGVKELTPEVRELLTATGFWRTAIDGTSNFERNRPLERYQLLHDTIENLTSNLLGLTVQCARCHDHKFDPITQKDYYRLMACLTPAYNPDHWLMPHERYIPDTSDAEKAEIRQHNLDIDRRAGELNHRLSKLRRPYEQLLVEAKYQALPEDARLPLRHALTTSADKRTAEQKDLAARYETNVRVTNEEVTAALNDDDRPRVEELDDRIADLRARHRSPGKIQALFDVGPLPATHLLKRGNHETPGAAVEPGIPSVLAGSRAFRSTEERYGSSGRRLALARALTEPDSVAAGLLARVQINRMWQHHFGRGLVATPGNLGSAGAAPTHPELLDWLATEFMRGGWKSKALHRLMVTSSTYRQAVSRSASPAGPEAASVDPDNRLLWKKPLQRLESEIVRDALLAVSGKLDVTAGGPPIPLEGKPDGTVVVSRRGLATPTSPYRRSLYLLARRNFHQSLLAVFDQPLMATSCTCRGQSAVVAQALTMLNDGFVHEQASALAGRVTTAAGGVPAERVRTAFRMALARPPSTDEADWGAALLEKHARRYREELAGPDAADRALTHLCHMLLNTSEFLYVE